MELRRTFVGFQLFDVWSLCIPVFKVVGEPPIVPCFGMEVCFLVWWGSYEGLSGVQLVE